MRCPRLTNRSFRHAATAFALAFGAVAACAPAGPRAVRYGDEACGFCRMTITDRRFGGQVSSARGRLEVFDAVECLADYVNTSVAAPPATEPHAWVADFQHPGRWIPVDSARFVRLARAGSPMGAGLAALRAGAPAGDIAIDGPVMTWTELLAARRAARTVQSSHADRAAPAMASAAGAAHAD